jgi:beta-phosphoglucomutase-like phosphatase (HAD superfamily)
MRIAVDIDSTIHHYWDVLAEVARRRFGVELPYDEHRTWGITTLAPDDLHACVAETHEEAQVLAGRPYPGAVEALRDWHAAGHYIHVTSHRVPESLEATARWLDAIGLPYDDLRCDFGKVARCVELEIDVLIDDSPVNIQQAREAGILPATIVHPWNEELCAGGDVVCGRDWAELRRRLEPVLGASPRPQGAGRT